MCAAMKWWLCLRLMWTLLLLTWSVCLMFSEHLLCAALAFALAAAELLLSTALRDLDTPDPMSVLLVGSYNLVLYSTNECTGEHCLAAAAIINEFIIFMRGSVSSCLLSLKSRAKTCYSTNSQRPALGHPKTEHETNVVMQAKVKETKSN